MLYLQKQVFVVKCIKSNEKKSK
jgi:hypothetical protein